MYDQCVWWSYGDWYVEHMWVRSIRSFTWFSWGYLLSTDISCRPQFRRFLPCFLCCYLFSEWNIYFIILVFSHPILFSLFLFLCSTFLDFYFLSVSSVFLCISSTFSFSFSLFLCLSSTFFLAAFFLSPLTFFLYHLIFLSAFISFFAFYYLSWISSTFILFLSSIIFPLLVSLYYLRIYVYLFIYYYYEY